jgi:hypothetical protein
MSTTERAVWNEKNRILVAVYPDEETANIVVKRLIEMDFQMDLISVLGRIHASGDDPLGIYSLNAGERMKVWGTHGLFWGGLWGMLAGAAGLFIIPGIGTLAAAGYIVEAIAGGAALGGGAMAGAAAVSQLAVALHRTGIPEKTILALHQAIEAGRFLVMLRGAESEIPQWREVLVSARPSDIQDLPYSQATDEK